MSLGFKHAGYELVGAFENWKPAIEVYARNFDSPVYERDLSRSDVVPEIGTLEPQVIIGGPPCQDFSQAGKRTDVGARAALSVTYGEIIAATRPAFLVMENVPRMRNSAAMQTIREQLKSCGYGLNERVLDASLCGVPQKRKRFFLVGALGAEDGFLDEYLDEMMADKPLTLREYMGDELGIDYYFRIPRSYGRRAIFSVDEPCVTIRGVDRPIPSTYKLHPNDAAGLDQARCLTPKERSRVQTFPADFELVGSKTDVNQMVGNAVPVNMAEFVATAIQHYVERTGYAVR